MSTLFTKIINGDIPSYKIAEDEHAYAFLDINPVQKGHTLVVPKKEVDYIYDLDDNTLSHLHLFAKKVAKALEKTVTCERIGVAVIGLEVPHAHIHLIPINKIADMDFKNERVKLTEQEFQKLAEEISSHLEE